MKRTARDKDELDRAWLRTRLGIPEAASSPATMMTVPRWLRYGLLTVATGLALAWAFWWDLHNRSRPE